MRANRPIFKIFVKKPLFLNFFSLFFPFFFFPPEFTPHYDGSGNDKKKTPATNGRAKYKFVSLFAFLFEDRLGGLRAEDVLKAMGNPLGIIIKANLSIKAIQTTIARDNIKADAVVQLA